MLATFVYQMEIDFSYHFTFRALQGLVTLLAAAKLKTKESLTNILCGFDVSVLAHQAFWDEALHVKGRLVDFRCLETEHSANSRRLGTAQCHDALSCHTDSIYEICMPV